MTRRRFFFLAALFVAALGSTATLWLAALGRFLVRSDEPFQAEFAVVLGGDYYGRRVRAAGDLVRQGYARKALVSGNPFHYDLCECDLAIDHAVRSGFPREYFERFESRALSTTEEVIAIGKELNRRSVKRALLVTSTFHTRRAGRNVDRLTSGIEFRVIPAKDEFFTPEGWWKSREGRKSFAFEAMKTVADYMGL